MKIKINKFIKNTIAILFIIAILFMIPVSTVFGAANTVKSMKLSNSTYTYGYLRNNSNIVALHIPNVIIKNSKGQTLKEGKDYSLCRPNDWDTKLPGKFTIFIYFQGNYTGFSSLSYTVKPRSTTLSSIVAKSKGLTVKWNKKSDTCDISGYQIQYSTSSNFKNAKTITVNSKNTISKSITGLTAKKKYYVRIRTLYKYNNSTYDKRYRANYCNKGIVYSSWSSAKFATTKK